MRPVGGLLVLALAGCCSVAPTARPPVVSGTVRFTGELPKRRPFNTSAVPGAPEGGVPREDLVVDERGGVRWAFVYVGKGLEGRTFTPPSSPVRMEQSGLRYQPHVVGLQSGQPLLIRNREAFLHSVHMVSDRTVQPPHMPQQEGETRRFDLAGPEIMVKLRCDVHPWMTAWAGVLDHPFFAVTDAEGKFEIKNLPPGKYTVGVWHETLAPEEREITVGADVDASFTLKKK